MTQRTEPAKCPAGCGYILDAVTGVSGADTPREGDFSLCAKCGSFLKYEKGLTLREFTHDELVDLDTKTRKMLHDTHAAWTYAVKGRIT